MIKKVSYDAGWLLWTHILVVWLLASSYFMMWFNYSKHNENYITFSERRIRNLTPQTSAGDVYIKTVSFWCRCLCKMLALEIDHAPAYKWIPSFLGCMKCKQMNSYLPKEPKVSRYESAILFYLYALFFVTYFWVWNTYQERWNIGWSPFFVVHVL